VIYVRGEVEPFQLGKGLVAMDLDGPDHDQLARLIRAFTQDFQLDAEKILEAGFRKVMPSTHRPYGSMYAY
jgi:glutamate synthase domain-containing protein 3